MKRLFASMAVMMLIFGGFGSELLAGGMGKMSGEGAMQGAGTTLAIPRASEIIGRSVTNDQNQFLGKVNDLIVSGDGRVAYLVIASGGVLGFGERLCAIPWRESSPRVREDALVVNISQERFASAPSFESWADFREGEYEERVRAYYGEEPASEMHRAMPMTDTPMEPMPESSPRPHSN